MILQLLRQFLNNLDRCSASFCFGLSLRFPCSLPKRISSRVLSKSMFIPQNHPKSQQRVRTRALKEKTVFRASLALSMLEIELYQSHISSDRVRSGYEVTCCSQQLCCHLAISSHGAYETRHVCRWVSLALTGSRFEFKPRISAGSCFSHQAMGRRINFCWDRNHAGINYGSERREKKDN